MPFRPPGVMELIIILLIVMVIFGVGKLPQIGGALGKGIREFRRGQAGEDDESSKEKGAQADTEEKESRTDTPKATGRGKRTP